MDYRSSIEEDLKKALKAKDSARVSTLRMLLTSLKNKEVDKKRLLTEDEFLAVVKTQIKQRTESIESFKKGQRFDLAEKEEKERNILQSFVPAQLSEEDLSCEVEDAIKALEATGPRDMGKVMKYLMEKHAARVDGKVLSEMVRKRLSS